MNEYALHDLHEELDNLEERGTDDKLYTLVRFGEVAAMIDKVYEKHQYSKEEGKMIVLTKKVYSPQQVATILADQGIHCEFDFTNGAKNKSVLPMRKRK